MAEIDVQRNPTLESAREIEAEINESLGAINQKLKRGRAALVRGRTLARFIVPGIIFVVGLALLFDGANTGVDARRTVELSLGTNFIASASLFLLIELGWRVAATLISEKTVQLGTMLQLQHQYRRIRKLNGEAVTAREQGNLELARKKQAYCQRKLRHLRHHKQILMERLKAERLLDNFLKASDQP